MQDSIRHASRHTGNQIKVSFFPDGAMTDFIIKFCNTTNSFASMLVGSSTGTMRPVAVTIINVLIAIVSI
jgi:hypothetical protein